MTYEERENKMFALWDDMVEFGIATETEIGIACHFNGRTLETLEDLLFYKTGCRDIASVLGEEEEE